MFVIGFLLVYITIVFGSMFFSSILNKKIEKTIAINMALIILELYLFGILGILKQGVYIIVILNIILGIIAIIKKKKEILELIVTPGFAFFTIVYFVLMITSFNKALTHWDQFWYRSVNTKVMFYTDTLLTEYGRIYPPASTLLQYFFMKMIGIYVQGVEAFAMQIFGISLLLPVYENIKKGKLKNIVVGLIIILLPAVFTNLIFYESSYPDATLGLLLAYMLYTYFFEKDFKTNIISNIVAVSIIVLMKPAGIAISLIIASVFTIYEILKNKYYKKENIKSILKNKNIKMILAILLISIMIFVSYRLVIKTYTSNKVNADNGRVSNDPVEYVTNSITTTIFGIYRDNNDAAESNRGFISSIYTVKGFNYPIGMSLATSSIVIAIVYILYYYKTENKEIKYQTIGVISGLILYMMFLQLSYLLKFITSEMLRHNGIDRYFPTYLLAMLCFIVFVIIKDLNKKENVSKKYIILLAAILLITPIGSVCDATITSGIYNINSIEYINNGKNIADKINSYIEDESKVITVSQTRRNELINLMLKYYLYPDHEVSVKKYLKEENIKATRKTIESNKYNYIYILDTDENLNNIFKEIFNEMDILENKTLYKIETQNNETINLIKQEYIDEII